MFHLYWTAVVLSFGTTRESFILEDGRLIVRGKAKKVGGGTIIPLENMYFQVHSLRISETAMELSSY